VATDSRLPAAHIDSGRRPSPLAAAADVPNLPVEGAGMVGVIVTFRYGADFDVAKLRKVAEGAQTLFEGMPGLRSKVFTLNPEAREATNFYVWDVEGAAKQFFSEEMRARVTRLYGVSPSVSFVEIAALVDNAHAYSQPISP
jgi:hypothetical protein